MFRFVQGDSVTCRDEVFFFEEAEGFTNVGLDSVPAAPVPEQSRRLRDNIVLLDRTAFPKHDSDYFGDLFEWNFADRSRV
jgi:hypothetical protein